MTLPAGEVAFPKPRARKPSHAQSVFLNCPYDHQFQDSFLAYLVGISCFGLTPRTTLEVAGGEQRLRRIGSLIQSCGLSFHDLSRVELQSGDPETPRFNMPFEAGLAVMYSLVKKFPGHTYFIFEADYRRLQKSLSDLGGSDVYPHGGTQEGILREIGNALFNSSRRPTVTQMMKVLKQVAARLPVIMNDAGSETLYTPRFFSDLVVFTNNLVNRRFGHQLHEQTTASG